MLRGRQNAPTLSKESPGENEKALLAAFAFDHQEDWDNPFAPAVV